MSENKTDTEKAYSLLRAIEQDLRKFVTDSEGIDPVEFFEDVHLATVEALTLLGVSIDAADEYEFGGLIEEYEKRMDSASLEDFDPMERKQ